MRILLTGGTGLIGGAVLHEALSSRPDAEWVALVRATDAAAGRERLIARLSRFTDQGSARRLLAPVTILPGDLTKADQLAHAALGGVSHILHLAADTAWWGRQRVRRVNHDGTLALARLAGRLPRLERLLHVSTAMICGAAPPRLVEEEFYPRTDVDHLVDYSRSKAETEMALAARHAGLPIVVARPSIVVGHATLGASPSGSILWVVRAADRLRLVSCPLDGSIDIVPADWTARALLHLLAKPDLTHSLYHLSAGEGARTRWSDLGRAFTRADGVPRHYHDLEAEDGGLLRQRFAAAFGLNDPVRVTMYRAMRAYYRFCRLNTTFANHRLLAEGVAPPPSLPDYLGTCLANSAGIVEQFADDLDMFLPATADAA